MVTRRQLVCALREKGVYPRSSKFESEATNYLLTKFNISPSNVSKENRKLICDLVIVLRKKILVHLNEAHRNFQQMLNLKATWFDIEIQNPIKTVQKKPENQEKSGRPRKSFEDKSRTGKYEEAKSIKSDNSLNALLKAASLKATENGEQDLAFILRKLEQDPSAQGTFLRNAIKPTKEKLIFTPEEALALIIELGLTRESYEKLRKKSKKRNACIHTFMAEKSVFSERC